MQLLVDHKEQLVSNLRHTAVVISHIDVLGLLHQHLHSRFAQVLDQGLILRQTLVRTIENDTSLLVLALANQTTSLSNQLRNEVLLQVVQTLNYGAILLEHLILALRHRTRDNQRRTSIVDQNRVGLIDDCIVQILALYQIGRRRCHIIAQIVETKLIVSTEGNIGQIGALTLVGIGLMHIDTIDRQTVELIHRAHPLAVTTRQIVVHRYYVYALASQCVKEYGQCCNQSLTLTRCHLGNTTAKFLVVRVLQTLDTTQVQYDTTKQLAVVVNHIPLQQVTACDPTILINGFALLVDRHEILASRQVLIELRCRHHDLLALRETASRRLHNCKCVGQNVVEFLLDLLIDNLFELLDALALALLLGQPLILSLLALTDICLIECGLGLLQLALQRCDLVLLGSDELGYLTTQRRTTLTQLVIGQFIDFNISLFDLLHKRLDQSAILIRFRSEEQFNGFL